MHWSKKIIKKGMTYWNIQNFFIFLMQWVSEISISKVIQLKWRGNQLNTVHWLSVSSALLEEEEEHDRRRGGKVRSLASNQLNPPSTFPFVFPPSWWCDFDKVTHLARDYGTALEWQAGSLAVHLRPSDATIWP